MVEICFKSNQKVGAFLRPDVTLWCLRSNKGLVRIFRKRGCIQGERRARHNELRESLVMVDVSAWTKQELHPRRLTFNSFELVSMHSFMHVSKKST